MKKREKIAIIPSCRKQNYNMMNETSNLVVEVSTDGEESVDVTAAVSTLTAKPQRNKWVVCLMLALNLANSTLGAGVLGLPLVARDSGVVAGIVMLVLCSLLTDWTLHLLLESHLLSGCST